MCVYIECILQFLYLSEMADLKKLRICIQFCFILEKPHSETYELFKNAFYCDTMSRIWTFEWFLYFTSDPTSIDFEHSGHPLSSQTDEDVEKVCQLIHGERWHAICNVHTILDQPHVAC